MPPMTEQKEVFVKSEYLILAIEIDSQNKHFIAFNRRLLQQN